MHRPLRFASLVLALAFLAGPAPAQESPVATPSPERYRHLSSTGELPPRSPAILPIRQSTPGSFVVSNRYLELQSHMPQRYRRQVSLGATLTEGKSRLEMLRDMQEAMQSSYRILEERMLSKLEKEKEREAEHQRRLETETDYTPPPPPQEPPQHQPLQTLPDFPLRGRFF